MKVRDLRATELFHLADHSFDRTSGRIQILGTDSQTDLFAGYQHKDFGLYGMYTGDLYTAFNPYEHENIKTKLYFINHRSDYGEGSHFEITALHRNNSDHYLFNRFSPNQDFVHDSKVNAFGISGSHDMDQKFNINYALQLTSDKIDSSSLENGKFTSRDYYKIAILPEYLIDQEKGISFL